MRYVVDTNVFNRIADGRFSRAELPQDAELVATHIQIDEIKRTTDPERRGVLFLTFAMQQPDIVPTESAVWNVSRWGQAKWGQGQHHAALRTKLDSKNDGKANNLQDVLIAEVALSNGYGLVTADEDLAAATREFTDKVIRIAT
ncbi:MAG: type II toxin-antitoxin system VapC family toxin [Betaproteobacteria bacterium]|nr:type II toxin-antitoxin system VapC family toxin [Betaproteobacteria bacterium]